MPPIWPVTPNSISIHALCEEGDGGSLTMLDSLSNFYPRPLRGGRLSRLIGTFLISIFLSTPSARRATVPVPDPVL